MSKRGAPSPPPGPDATEFQYPGNRLGMPAHGTGSVASVPRRLIALVIDWVLSLAVAGAVVPDAGPTTQGYATLLIFAVQATLLLTFAGTTIGKRLAGIRMAATGERPWPWPFAILLRTVLLCLVIPAVVYDRDHRGLHDRAAGTVSARY